MIKINNSFEGEFETGIRNEDTAAIVFLSIDPREESGHRRMTNFDGRSPNSTPFRLNWVRFWRSEMCLFFFPIEVKLIFIVNQERILIEKIGNRSSCAI